MKIFFLILSCLCYMNMNFAMQLQELESLNIQLIIASFLGNVEQVGILLKHGADPNNTSGQLGNTPLHTAVSRGDELIVKILLYFGANQKIPNQHGLTPIDYAIRRPSIADLLRRYASQRLR
jgi:ankyrin repeat protein